MGRLTDRKTAAELKENVEKLRAVGIEPTISDLRYIKLAEYENRYERTTHKEKEYCKDCAYHRWHGTWLFCDKYDVPVVFFNSCDDFVPSRTYITQKDGD